MSLTNALDAIAVVGAIVMVGERKSEFAPCSASSPIVAATSNVVGGFFINRRMLKNVQDQPPGEKNNEPARRNPVHHRIYLLIASALFILSLKWMSSPPLPVTGSWLAKSAWSLAIAGTLLHHGIVDWTWIGRWPRARQRNRHPARHGPHDRRPPANRPQPRLRRTLRHLSRHRGILSAHPKRPKIHDVRPLHGSHPRRPHLHRQPDGRRKTARKSFRSAPSPIKDRTSLTSCC